MKSLLILALSGILLTATCTAEIRLVDPSDPVQREALVGKMKTLEEWFSDRALSPEDWAVQGWSSLDWAWYIGGLLFSLGYEVQLVRAGEAWWTLAGFLLDGQEVWFPVVPGALAADTGGTADLAYVPFVDRSFDRRYLGWEEARPLPENTPPVADARSTARSLPPGRETWFLGATSYDPDGEIVLYLWSFGDGTTKRGVNVKHAFRRPGRYTVSLVVVDKGGLMAQDELDIVVEDPSDCGCGS